MGLDVTAYEKLIPIKIAEPSGLCDDDYELGIRLYVNPSFVSATDGLEGGIYESVGHEHDFHAGAYSGYNAWRAELARMIGTTTDAVWRDPQPGPFVELINNSDCEGFIGPRTAAKLARDFAEWQERADAHDREAADAVRWPHWFAEKYALWRKAFELAAGSGAVVLH